MTPKNDFSGYVSLEINADSNLNAEIDKEKLDRQSQIAELTIKPNELIEIQTYEILLKATYHKKSKCATFLNLFNKIKFPILYYLINQLLSKINDDSICSNYYTDEETILLEVEMFNWTSESLPNAIIKRDEFIDWLEINHPEFGSFSTANSFAYITYPAHLVVEHWTFLYDEWEMRICYHVMIPPYDWSMIWLRPRGEIDAIFSAKRESDGTTYEILVSEYPIFYNY